MSKILKMVGLAMVVVAILALVLAGTVAAAGNKYAGENGFGGYDGGGNPDCPNLTAGNGDQVSNSYGDEGPHTYQYVHNYSGTLA